MIASFYSVDDENNKIIFKSNYEIKDNTIIFEDKSYENTKIYLYKFKDRLIFKRVGNCNMTLELIEGQALEAYYANELGLEFKFIAKCNKLSLDNNRIDIEYDMILDNDLLSSHKIWIILR